MSDTADLLLEIGCEELPASFVDAALAALPSLVGKRLSELRLQHGDVRVMGTPRRLAVWVKDVATNQSNLDEEVTGPPVKAAFKDGAPTRAAEAFAKKLGVAVDDLRRVETPKGEYLVGNRKETGRPAVELLPTALSQIITAIPFRKSMRWGSSDFAFGRPIQWLVALFGEEPLRFELAGVTSGRASRGHRFLAPGEVPIPAPAGYVSALRDAHVWVDPDERLSSMKKALESAACEAGGSLVEDEFLMRENLGMVEESHVVAGAYDEEFLELPEGVILAVAKGHQRYFGVRNQDGKLMPRYLSVVNTANEPETIQRGSDRVMHARLADAQFFYREDLKIPMEDRRAKLEGIVFQKRLGTVLAKADRIERLARELGLLLQLPEPTLMAAASGAHLCKCDLVSLMVGEFPELEGEMGASYARAQGVDAAVCDVIREHYLPRGASSATPSNHAAALVAIADRLDTLVGCFGIGLTPTGAADPYGLRRACIGILRTLMDQDLDLDLADAIRAAADGYEGTKLDATTDELVAKVGAFAADRLKGVLADKLPTDVVQATLAVASGRPLDARARAQALAHLDPALRAQVGEVFKRATNIAKEAPAGDPAAPGEGAHASEVAVHEAFVRMRADLQSKTAAGDYAGALKEIGQLAPLLHQYFLDVFVMDEDQAVRHNRLRLMRSISATCASIARLELLGQG